LFLLFFSYPCHTSPLSRLSAPIGSDLVAARSVATSGRPILPAERAATPSEVLALPVERFAPTSARLIFPTERSPPTSGRPIFPTELAAGKNEQLLPLRLTLGEVVGAAESSFRRVQRRGVHSVGWLKGPMRLLRKGFQWGDILSRMGVGDRLRVAGDACSWWGSSGLSFERLG
jgi:hypothetical protein